MAKIVLLWNTHRNENQVTREMAALLRERLAKLGNEAEVFMVPDEITMFGHYSGPARENKFFIDSINYAENILPLVRRQFPGCAIIDLHTTPQEQVLQPVPGQKRDVNLRKIKNWRASVGKAFNPTMEGQLEIRPFEGGYIVEMPAHYSVAGRELLAARPNYRHAHYFERQADSRASKAANFLSPGVVAKLAHLIDTTVKTDLGIYKVRPGKVPHLKRVFRPASEKKMRHGPGARWKNRAR
ncbi:Uncharacterised protein [uncultured archaeon]|nr:Uncharacterised protein [uncultured archaeon]